MTVRELSSEQRTALKERMVDDEIYESEGRCASFGELADADETVSDEALDARFEGTEFVEEDFM